MEEEEKEEELEEKLCLKSKRSFRCSLQESCLYSTYKKSCTVSGHQQNAFHLDKLIKSPPIVLSKGLLLLPPPTWASASGWAGGWAGGHVYLPSFVSVIPPPPPSSFCKKTFFLSFSGFRRDRQGETSKTGTGPIGALAGLSTATHAALPFDSPARKLDLSTSATTEASRNKRLFDRDARGGGKA